MKLNREQMQMILALFIVAAISAILLSLTDMLTREPIAQAQRQALHSALLQVLPEHDNEVQDDLLEVDGRAIYPARLHGRLTGLAWEVIAPDGYSGSIRILVGIHPDGHVQAIRVTEHKETPGLGDGIVHNKSWLDSFHERGLSGVHWAVKKDGGDFDQFTGATITPRAVVKAVKGALVFYQSQQIKILDQINSKTAVVAPSAAGGGK
ncbi:MAG: RnfABCDGE type electron transport complex subunit G [Mariprofundus sp.]|nr:RnfABCDGE type electron transport complex subunit G [Mariprofundus sp.]